MDFLSCRAKDFSGAEIEQVIYEPQGFTRGEKFTQGDLLDAIASTVPLFRLAQPQIEALKTRAVRSGSKSASKQETVSSSDLMLTLLEVDAGRITCYRFLSLMFISKSQ